MGAKNSTMMKVEYCLPTPSSLFPFIETLPPLKAVIPLINIDYKQAFKTKEMMFSFKRKVPVQLFTIFLTPSDT